MELCFRHRNRWKNHQCQQGAAADFGQWLADQQPDAGYGICHLRSCQDLAASPLGLCTIHLGRYRAAGRPGGAKHPKNYYRWEQQGQPAPVSYDDEPAFRQWCQVEPPVMRVGESSTWAACARW